MGLKSWGSSFKLFFRQKEHQYQQKRTKSLLINAGRMLVTNQLPHFWDEETEAKESNSPSGTLRGISRTSHLRTTERLKAIPSFPLFTCTLNFPLTFTDKLLYTKSCTQREETKLDPVGVYRD